MKIVALRSMLLLSLFGGGSIFFFAPPSPAQGNLIIAFGLNQAKNLARQAAEDANGGLGQYRAEPSMHGDPLASPYVDNGDGSYTFTFRGRRPESMDYTYETVVTVSAEGIATIEYNGDIRSESFNNTTITPASLDLNQAKNLARQAAERENGGLSNYRAEPAMHGLAEESPYVNNSDGSYTFTFKGRRPESFDYTYETEVKILADGTPQILYNGAIRTENATIETGANTIDLNQAKNLARQAAEQANGGLSNYRAEPAMHGNPNESPYVLNADGSYTFTFQGRRPSSFDYSIESVVTVTPDGTVTINSNTSM
ncbi:MAG: hypothetical protein VKJ86_07150 [Synechococcus sp.]|nr:hypothetical protein [Synechococcus sp.]